MSTQTDFFRFCQCEVKHGFGIYSFRPAWLCLIIKVLVTRVKFRQPSCYCSVINRSQNECFWLLLRCYPQVRTRKAKVLELGYYARSSVRLSNDKKNKAMHDMSAHTLPLYYQPWLNWFRLLNIHTANKHLHLPCSSTANFLTQSCISCFTPSNVEENCTLEGIMLVSMTPGSKFHIYSD